MTSKAVSISPYDDVIDVRDVIARFEELDSKRSLLVPDEDVELDQLAELLGELRGNGGDEEWQGAWYPMTLIRDSYFLKYAMTLAEDIGAFPQEPAWPLDCIDWDMAARELQVDYMDVEFDGITYWYR